LRVIQTTQELGVFKDTATQVLLCHPVRVFLFGRDAVAGTKLYILFLSPPPPAAPRKVFCPTSSFLPYVQGWQKMTRHVQFVSSFVSQFLGFLARFCLKYSKCVPPLFLRHWNPLLVGRKRNNRKEESRHVGIQDGGGWTNTWISEGFAEYESDRK
jgi:hypothetical protein